MAERTLALPPASDLPQEAKPPAQLTLFTKDYELLCQARDAMCYRALGSIAAAICFCRANRNSDAIAILTSALERYEMADQELQRFKLHVERKGARHVS